MIPLNLREPPFDQIDLSRRGGDASGRFLLKRVQDVDTVFESHCIDGSPSIAVMRTDNFKHTGTAETLQRLRGGIGLALLRSKKCPCPIARLKVRGNDRRSLRRSNPPYGL